MKKQEEARERQIAAQEEAKRQAELKKQEEARKRQIAAQEEARRQAELKKQEEAVIKPTTTTVSGTTGNNRIVDLTTLISLDCGLNKESQDELKKHITDPTSIKIPNSSRQEVKPRMINRREQIRLDRIRAKEKAEDLRDVFLGSILNVIISIGIIIWSNVCDTTPMYIKYIIVAIATICGALIPFMIVLCISAISEDSTFFTKPFVRQAEKAIKIRVQDSFKWTIIEFCPVIIAIAIASVTLLSSINSIILSSLIINFGVIVTAHINSFKSYTDSPQAPSMYPTSAHWGMILLNSVIAFSIPTIIYLFLVA